jgi:hypothetical protein
MSRHPAVRNKRNSATVPTGLGTFVHESVTAPTEPEHRPPPASRLPSWVTNASDHCTDPECENRMEDFVHRHVRGFPLAEYIRVKDDAW